MVFSFMSFVSWQLPVFFSIASRAFVAKLKNPFPAVLAGLLVASGFG
jgi:hypothetical protein